jgi:hypothetical protein
MRPITSEQIADRVEWLRAHEDDPPPEEDTRSEQQRKRAEYDRQRPKRHQITLPFPFKPKTHPDSEFSPTYPHEDVPFVQKVKPKKQSKVKGKLKEPKAPYRIVVRRRYPLHPQSVPESVTESPSESGTHSTD